MDFFCVKKNKISFQCIWFSSNSQFFLFKNKSKQNVYKEFKYALDIVGKPFVSKDLMKVIWKILDLRCLKMLNV
jgi:dTDP-4-dehydrorhamnose reductase